MAEHLSEFGVPARRVTQIVGLSNWQRSWCHTLPAGRCGGLSRNLPVGRVPSNSTAEATPAAETHSHRLASRSLCLVPHVIRTVGQVLIDASEHRRIFMPHQQSDGQRINAPFQRIGRPRVAERIERVSRRNQLGHSTKELYLRFLAEFGGPFFSLHTFHFLCWLQRRHQIANRLGSRFFSLSAKHFLPHPGLNTVEDTVHSLRRPRSALTVAEQFSLRIGFHEPFRDRQRVVIQVDDARRLLPLRLLLRKDPPSVLEIDVVRNHSQRFLRATTGLVRRYQQVLETGCLAQT